jgi:hypothetical protein
MTVAADAPRSWRSTTALECPERAHAAGILMDPRARDPVARRVLAEVNARGYLDGDRSSGYPVDYEAERRPPPGVGHELAAVLPEVFEPVAGEAEDEQPWRSRDGRRGEDDEGRSETDLDGDHGGAPVGDREADVDRGDQYETEGVDRRRIKPPEGEWRRRLERSEHDAPEGWRADRLLARERGICGCWRYGRAHRLLPARNGHLSLAAMPVVYTANRTRGPWLPGGEFRPGDASVIAAIHLAVAPRK